MTKVKNLNGTSDRTPNGYSSWLAFWESKTGIRATSCGAVDCKAKNNLIGAHVKKAGTADYSHHIVPLCQSCNKRNDEFNVDLQLVSVN